MKKIEALEKENALYNKKDEIFLTLLYDERLSEDSFYVPEDAFRRVGGYNPKIRAKRTYELLLRLADCYCISIEEWEQEKECPEGYVLIKAADQGPLYEGFRTDCYIISKYKEKLLSFGCLNEVMQSVLYAAKEAGMKDEAARLLETMLLRKEDYYAIDDAVRPILIYVGEDICYNVLNLFAKQFGDALVRAGETVEYFDVEREELAELSNCIGRHYRAIIGIQTYVFGLKLKNYANVFLHDVIIGPIFNFTFDHPVWLKNQLQNFPSRLRILTLDTHYVDFIERYYGKKTYLFPPAGMEARPKFSEKKYDLSFIGSYGDYWQEALLIHQMDRRDRFFANRFLLIMRKNPRLTAEEAFSQTLDFYGVTCGDAEFLELFYKMRRVIFCVMHYYRCRIIKSILKSGLTLHVFGDCWKRSPFFGEPGLICHADVTMEESMEVWRKSKLSLNVMSWHKGGFTERMANIMLSKAALVTDETSYLNGRFSDGEDLIVFRLKEWETLPELLKGYFNQPEKIQMIAENGYEKAKKHHTWDARAKEFLEVILEGELCEKRETND